MRFINFLLEASTGADMWDKYYKGRRVLTTVKSSGAKVYDATTQKLIPGSSLKAGQEVLVIGEYPLLPAPTAASMQVGSAYDLRVGSTDPANAASKNYQQRDTQNFQNVQYAARVTVAVYDSGHQEFYLVSISDINKPLQKKLFTSLKPQKLLQAAGKMSHGFAVFSSIADYKTALLSGIDNYNELSVPIKEYLTALVVNGQSKSITDIYQRTGIADSVPSFNALNNDFLELIGPIYVKRTGIVEIPLKSNQVMIDFKVAGVGYSSKRAGILTNTLKGGDVLAAIADAPVNVKDFSYKLMKVLATASIREAPKELTQLFNTSKFAKELPIFAGARQWKGKWRTWLPATGTDWTVEDLYNMQMTTIEKFITQCVSNGTINFDPYINIALDTVGIAKMNINPRTGVLENIQITEPGSSNATNVTVRHKGRGIKGGERMGFVL